MVESKPIEFLLPLYSCPLAGLKAGSSQYPQALWSPSIPLYVTITNSLRTKHKKVLWSELSAFT